MNILTVTEFKNLRVLTTQQIAECYETDSKTISYNFNGNKDRYQEGKHYILLQGDELRAFREIHDLPININKFYLWTEKGTFLHAKSLNTDKAWEVYDKLVDEYFKKAKPLSEIQILQRSLLLLDKQDVRISNLENNMVIDYGQQQVLKNTVNAVVLQSLGGKGTSAYQEIAKVVFSECNKDFQNYFNVNSRNNTPKVRFDEAIRYVKSWQPCTNTKLKINNCNAQVSMAV